MFAASPHRRSLAAAALAGSMMAGAVPAAAQIIKISERREPLLFASLSVGYIQLPRVNDGSTGTSWDFSSAAQYRGSLEWGLKNRTGVGVAATYARAPLGYYDGGACAPCNAHATLWSMAALLHIGGGPGAHQIIDVALGTTGYSGFKRDAGGAALAPIGTDLDFSFGIGYGLGYSFSERSELMLVQEYVTVLHQRRGLPGGTDIMSQQYVTRVGMRLGMGGRRRGI